MVLFLDQHFSIPYIINGLIGVLSAMVDNIPLVAGTMGMYPTSIYPPDSMFWELLAYYARTGGSLLIIGLAARVAIMGILKIEFVWYLKNISWLAFIGYLASMFTYFF